MRNGMSSSQLSACLNHRACRYEELQRLVDRDDVDEEEFMRVLGELDHAREDALEVPSQHHEILPTCQHARLCHARLCMLLRLTDVRERLIPDFCTA